MKKKLFAAASIACAAALATCALAACGDNTPPEEPPEEKFVFSYKTEQWQYKNASGADATLDYGLFVPDSYSATGSALPLITYVPDSGFVDKTVKALALGGQCLDSWITPEKIEKNPAIILFLTFTKAGAEASGNQLLGKSDVTVEGSEAAQVVEIIDSICESYNVDENRLYLTGQSMGGILDWSINTAYPDKFAATVYVGCQPGDDVDDDMYRDILEKKAFVDQKFVYIASRTDSKAPFGQDDVQEILDAEGVEYGEDYTLDKNDLEGNNSKLKTLFANNYDKYFVGFPNVAGGTNGGMEHLQSFAHCYAIDAIYDWLLAQSK